MFCGILGFGSPVFFSTVSESALEDAGEGTKMMEEEVVRQLRQNNLGPGGDVSPNQIDRRTEFAEVIEKKKLDHPELSISGGGSIFLICSLSMITLAGWISTTSRGTV